jgi:hypothetical protein
MCRDSFGDYSRTVPSLDPEAKQCPVRAERHAHAQRPMPVSTPIGVPSATNHSRTVLSSTPEASSVPSELKATVQFKRPSAPQSQVATFVRELHVKNCISVTTASCKDAVNLGIGEAEVSVHELSKHFQRPSSHRSPCTDSFAFYRAVPFLRPSARANLPLNDGFHRRRPAPPSRFG